MNGKVLSSAMLLRLASESMACGFDHQLEPDAVLDHVPAHTQHVAGIAARLDQAWNPDIPLHHLVQVEVSVTYDPEPVVGHIDVLASTWDALAESPTSQTPSEASHTPCQATTRARIEQITVSEDATETTTTR